MKNKKGFTLVELLAVIVVLGIIMALTASYVIDSVNESRKRTKFIAAKEIVEMAGAYMDAEESKIIEKIDENECVNVSNLISSGYLEEDVTNPATGKNRVDEDISGQYVCASSDSKLQKDYEVTDDKYHFDGYYYLFGQ